MSTNHRCHGRRGKRSHVISFIVAAASTAALLLLVVVAIAFVQCYVSLTKLRQSTELCTAKKEKNKKKSTNNNNNNRIEAVTHMRLVI